MTRSFYPYHPLKLRGLLAVAALVAVALAAWAVQTAVSTGQPLEWARAGLCLGLVLAMTYVFTKLAPKPEWGVSLQPTTLTVSRPINGSIELPWSAIREVRRMGPRRDTIVLFMNDDRRVLIAQHLFAGPAMFEALAAAIDERLPNVSYDA